MNARIKNDPIDNCLDEAMQELHTRYGFLLRSPTWFHDHKNELIETTAELIQQRLKNFDTPMLILLQNAAADIKQKEKRIDKRFRHIEELIHSLDTATPHLERRYGFLKQFNNFYEVKQFLTASNVNSFTVRVTKEVQMALMLSFGLGGAETMFNMLPFMSGPMLGLACLVVSISGIFYNELSVRPSRIKKIMHRIYKVLHGDSLEKTREKMRIVQLIRYSLEKIMHREVLAFPPQQTLKLLTHRE